MTTFHEPQPQSRRAVRQNEREAASGHQFPLTQPEANYSDPSAPRDMWDTTARRAAQPPQQPDPSPPQGRRAAAQPPAAEPLTAEPLTAEPLTAEPLTYMTESRSPVPSYDGPSFRAQPTPDLPPTQAIPRQEQPQYRVRDFSPEGRRSAAPQQAATHAAPTGIDYQTQARPPAPEAPADPHSRTFTRRELRAMQQAQDAAAPATPPAEAYAPPAAAPQYPAPAVPEYVAHQQQAPAQYSQPGPADYQAPAESYAPPVQPWAQPAQYPAPAPAPATHEPVAYQPLAQPESFPPVAPEPSTNTALTRALSEYDALVGSQLSAPNQAAPSQPVPAAGPAPWSPSSGHWAAQLVADDDPFETTLSRSIGSGHTATNALVLPGMPRETDIRGPLTSTGEVMLTGSIDLPRSLSSTGATGRMERDGIDALFDANDTEISSTDSAPVRAIRAVSTHHTGQGVTHTRKPKGAKALTALLIAASGMAVVVAGLLISAFAFNVL